MASAAQVSNQDTQGNTTSDDEAEIGQYLTGFALYLVASVITMAGFLLMLDSTVLVTVSIQYRHPPLKFSSGPLTGSEAIPSITSHFNSLKDIGWYGSAYLMTT